MIPDSEIFKCLEFEVKSKIGKLLMDEKIIEEYSVKIYEIDPYFYGHHKKKKVDKSKRKYIFKIDVYFTEYFLVVEIDEKTTKAEILFLKKKKKKTRGIRKKT